MAALLETQGLQGAVWATVDAEGGIATGAAGVGDARDGRPLGADDRVHVGSVAKTLLATAILRLVSEGRLALDTPVADLLPDVALDNRWAPSEPVRVRHLLDHTSGLDDARLRQVFSTKPGADMSLTDAFARGGRLRARSRPGTRSSYSNMGYTLLGGVIEAVTGERYEQYLDAALLRPLGLRDSTFAFVTQEGPGADPRLAMGHLEGGAVHAAVPSFLRPAGQFTTTAADMGRFARFLMSDGRVDGKPFIAPHLLAAMGEPIGTEAAEAGLRVGYGLGLARRDRHGAVGRCHGGSTIGYRAMFCLFPDRGRAFFLSINTDSETADYGRFDAALVRALEVDAPAWAPPRDAQDAAIDTTDWDGYYVPSPNRFASLAWFDTVFGVVRVRSDGAGLRIRSLQSREMALAPAGGPLFRAPERTLASHAVLVSREGARVIGTGIQSYEKAPLLKLVPLWISLAAGLIGLAYIALSGLVRLAMRRMRPSHPIFVPFIGVAALVLPLPLFHGQSFLQLGDLTPASGALAAVTAVLPLTMLVGLGLGLRSRAPGAWTALDVLAMLAVLQWALVLAAWGLVPLRLWA